jgi:hypothetical protein
MMTTINQSNVFIKPFLHQPMSQSAVQTVSNADVEAQWQGKAPKKGRSLGRNLERNQALSDGQSSNGCAGWRL